MLTKLKYWCLGLGLLLLMVFMMVTVATGGVQNIASWRQAMMYVAVSLIYSGFAIGFYQQRKEKWWHLPGAIFFFLIALLMLLGLTQP